MKTGETNGAIGARGELLVAADLFRQGFSVYRALSGSDAIDLLARKRGQVISIQVKSAIGRAGIRRCDVLAVVSEGIIRYRAINRRIARLFEECRVIRKVGM